MDTKYIPSGWNRQETEQEEKYWETVLDVTEKRLQRQNRVIEREQEVLGTYTRYHIIFLGFVFAMTRIPASTSTPLNDWRLLFACVPAVIGIMVSEYGRRKLATYKIGMDRELLQMTYEKSESYSSALRMVALHHEDMADKNRIHIDKNEIFRERSLILLAIGIGTLLAAIVIPPSGLL